MHQLIHLNQKNSVSSLPHQTIEGSIKLDVKKILLNREHSPIKVGTILKIGVKITLLPITILSYLIKKIFSTLAASQGLGNKNEIRNIDFVKKDKLLNMGGQPICFGFNKKALLEGMFFHASLPAENSKTILICAGSHHSYEEYTIPMVKAFISMGHNVMVFNYEGFGKSGGVASEKGVYRSVEAAYQYLKQEKGCKDEEIVAWGYSLGSGAVTNLASNHDIPIVLDRGFSSMSKVAYQSAPKGLKTIARIIFSLGARFDNFNKLKKIKGKVLVAQGMNDLTMKWKHHGKYLHDSILKNPHAVYLSVKSAHHHSDDKVWFSIGKDRRSVENFFNQI